ISKRDWSSDVCSSDLELDELRTLSRNAGDFLLRYEQQERERIGVPALKVGYNRVHGYYIELGKTHADKVPAEYTRRQTLKNAERSEERRVGKECSCRS